MTEEIKNAVISRSSKKINLAGTAFDVKELLVAGESLSECENVFDRKWNVKK